MSEPLLDPELWLEFILTVFLVVVVVVISVVWELLPTC